MLDDTLIPRPQTRTPRNSRPKTQDPKPRHEVPPRTPTRAPSNAECRLPNADSPLPNADSLLLRDYLDPDLTPLDLCDIHDITLVQLETWLESPKVTAALKSLERIETKRDEHLQRQARATARATLQRLATTAPAEPMTAAEKIRLQESQRKAASRLLGTNRCPSGSTTPRTPSLSSKSTAPSPRPSPSPPAHSPRAARARAPPIRAACASTPRAAHISPRPLRAPTPPPPPTSDTVPRAPHPPTTNPTSPPARPRNRPIPPRNLCDLRPQDYPWDVDSLKCRDPPARSLDTRRVAVAKNSCAHADDV